MRVALISDLHGNHIALQAVLDDIKQEKADKLICLGDVATLGPAPRETIALLRDSGCPCIMGNHDSFLLDPNLIYEYTTSPVIVESVRWCRDQLDQSDMDYIRSFLPSLELQLGERANLLCYHGSPQSNTEDILPTTPILELENYLNGHKATVFAGGHTHIQMLRQHKGSLIINTGSLGQPFEEFVNNTVPRLLPWAEYAIVSENNGVIDVDLRRIPFDIEKLKDSITACNIPMKGWMLNEYK